jgi:hypothetical protein
MTKYLVVLSVFAVGCSEARLPSGPGPVAAPFSLGAVPDARASAMAESDRDFLGTKGSDCASGVPIMTQANPRGDGVITFEFQIGYGTSKALLWVYRVPNATVKNPKPAMVLERKYEVGDGNPATYKSSLDVNDLHEEGHYKVYVQRLKCGNNIDAPGPMSEPKTFTIGSPYDPSVILTCSEGELLVETPRGTFCRPWA